MRWEVTSPTYFAPGAVSRHFVAKIRWSCQMTGYFSVQCQSSRSNFCPLYKYPNPSWEFFWETYDTILGENHIHFQHINANLHRVCERPKSLLWPYSKPTTVGLNLQPPLW